MTFSMTLMIWWYIQQWSSSNSRVLFQPVTEGYRNKDEFSIQTGIDGNPKTVGFFVGSPAEGPVVCVRGTHLINMRQSHKEVAQVGVLLNK